jgi:hypothetical protein
MKRNPKYKKLSVELPRRALVIYAGQRVKNALNEITAGMDVYLATRLQLVMQAVYDQGVKDGRKELIDRMDEGFDQIKGETNCLPPGRPRK